MSHLRLLLPMRCASLSVLFSFPCFEHEALPPVQHPSQLAGWYLDVNPKAAATKPFWNQLVLFKLLSNRAVPINGVPVGTNSKLFLQAGETLPTILEPTSSGGLLLMKLVNSAAGERWAKVRNLAAGYWNSNLTMKAEITSGTWPLRIVDGRSSNVLARLRMSYLRDCDKRVKPSASFKAAYWSSDSTSIAVICLGEPVFPRGDEEYRESLLYVWDWKRMSFKFIDRAVSAVWLSSSRIAYVSAYPVLEGRRNILERNWPTTKVLRQITSRFNWPPCVSTVIDLDSSKVLARSYGSYVVAWGKRNNSFLCLVRDGDFGLKLEFRDEVLQATKGPYVPIRFPYGDARHFESSFLLP